jgi:hypothetical protein
MPKTHRTPSRLAALSLAAAILCAGAVAEDDVREVQYRLIFHNFLDSEPEAASMVTGAVGRFNPIWYPDTTTFFHDSSHVGESIYEPNGRYLIRSMESSWYGSPGFPYKYTRDLVGADYPDAEFVEKFRKKIGMEPFSRVEYDARRQPWRFWSGQALERVFDRYYGGPENRFQHVTFGFIYDVAAKRYMTDYVTLLNHLLVTRRTEWMRLCEDYRTRALMDTNFDGSSAASAACRSLFTEEDREDFKTIETNLLYNPVGELMRRQIDGSLPSILRCIRIILRDYDPANHRRLKA